MNPERIKFLENMRSKEFELGYYEFEKIKLKLKH